MKPTLIPDVLDLTWKARGLGLTFNPLFTGEAGLGKSEICQQWVKKMQAKDENFGFLDLRIAYMEAPDMIGFPKEIQVDDAWRTIHCLPGFWPTSGTGLLLIEEPNRGTTGVMNTLMQLLTDRKVHDYTLPEGWIVAACINPESAEYDVNRMDAALLNRFEEYEVQYDSNSFMDYIERNNWSDTVQMYVTSASWTYKESSKISADGKYISPRTWSKVHASELAGLKDQPALHRITMYSILGKAIGEEYWKFCHKESPVTAQDLIKKPKDSLKRLKTQCNATNYKGDMVGITVDSIVAHYGGQKPNKDQVSEDVMCDVARIIPSDHAINLVKECGRKDNGGKMRDYFKGFIARHPDVAKIMKGNIKLNQALK